MQRREFIAAGASAVSQSNPIYAQPIGAVARRTVLANGIHLHFAEQGDRPRIRFGLERIIRYAAFCSWRANNTNSEAVRGSPMVAMPAAVRWAPALDHTIAMCRYREE
jgi:hypothetical protein